MSGTHIKRPRPNKCIDIILDKDFNKIVPKPVNNRPGFDIEYLRAYIMNYCSSYANEFEKLLEVEKRFDNLSIIRPHETPKQWAIRVRVALQALITEEKKESFYHKFCLFGSFGQGVTRTCYDNYEGRGVLIGYHRPSVHKSRMTICFDCWKLVKITKVESRKEYFSGWRRYGYEFRPEDLMKNHWDYLCSKEKPCSLAPSPLPRKPVFTKVDRSASRTPNNTNIGHK